MKIGSRNLWTNIVPVSVLAFMAFGCATAALPPGIDRDGYFEAEVYFATDREMTGARPTTFSGNRSPAADLTWGRVFVSIPDTHRVGEIEKPSWWVLRNRHDPRKYVVVTRTELFSDSGSFSRAVGEILANARRDDVLIFIHGYNTEFEEAAQRTAQLAYDLRFPGVPMFYSWPSKGTLLGYPSDEANMEWSTPHFEEFLTMALTDLSAQRVHVVAHSMGNRALLRTLERFDLQSLPEGSAELHQIILAAPDIDSDVFRQLSRHFPGKARRFTMYSSAEDKAILASLRFHGFSRAGGEIVVVNGVDTVDATEVETSFFEHAYFGDSLVRDMYGLIRNDLAPDERFGLERVSDSIGSYWRLVPGAFP